MLLWCRRFDQKTNEIFVRISALASKKRLNQKLYYTNYVRQPVISAMIFGLTSFYRLGQESLKKFHWFFGRNDDYKKTFRN